jgi:hypothetical protein
MPDPVPQQVLLKDPLSVETRKERRNLLAISALGIVMVKTGLVPTKISVLGVEFSQSNQTALLYTIAGIAIYFLLAFIFYALSDYSTYRIENYISEKTFNAQLIEMLVGTITKDYKNIIQKVKVLEEQFEQLNKESAEIKEHASTSSAEIIKSFKESATTPEGKRSVDFESKRLNALARLDELIIQLTSKIPLFASRKKEILEELAQMKRETTVISARTEAMQNSGYSVRLVKIVAISRLVFEFVLPIIIGLYGIWTLFRQK